MSTCCLPTVNPEPNFWGKSLSVDVKNCNAEIIRNPLAIQLYVERLIKMLDMKAYGECQVIHFGEDEKVAGLSFTQLISTSLISGHFADATNTAYIDIFSCKDYDADLVAKFTLEYFCGDEVTTHLALRQ